MQIKMTATEAEFWITLICCLPFIAYCVIITLESIDIDEEE